MMWASAGKTEQRIAQRAKVILLTAQGRRLPEISQRSGLSRQNCSRWRERFLRERIEGLKDDERSGRPRSIAPAKRLEVTKLACTKPKDGSNQWTVSSLAKAAGLGRTTIHRILNEGRLKPHKVETGAGRARTPSSKKSRRRSWDSISILPIMPSSSALTRNHSSRRLIGPNPSCPCGRAIPKGRRPPTKETAQPVSLPPSPSIAEK